MSEISNKFHPFVCYFCNREIRNESSQGHMAICGSVLEPCTQKCGAYVQRNLKKKHLQECVNNPKNINGQNQPVYETFLPHVSDGNFRRKNVVSQRSNTHRLSFDFGPTSSESDYLSLTSKISNLDVNVNKMSQNVNMLHNKHQEFLQVNQNNLLITKTELEKLQVQNRLFFEWRKVLDVEMEKVVNNLQIMQQYKIDIDNITRDMKKYGLSLNELFQDHEAMKHTLTNEQLTLKNDLQRSNAKLNEIHDNMVQENATVGGLWNDQNIKIELIQKSVNDMQKVIQEKENSYAKLVFDVRAVTQISSEATEKLEAQERKIEDLSKTLRQFKLDFELLEDNQARNGGTSNIPGYLVWKITDFSMKMENAKENNTVLKSPVFFSHHYGYKIRILFYLNGIKKWKGRHAIGCIHVLNGEYDLMLKWPCNIEGTFAVKDIETKNHAKDYVKPITAKRNSGDEENDDPQESSTQYIFLPHTTLNKSNYLQDDTLFLEIVINNPFKSLNETNL